MQNGGAVVYVVAAPGDDAGLPSPAVVHKVF
jgi:hypothetical protein